MQLSRKIFCGFIAAAIAAAFCLHPPLNSQDWAAWVGAIGTVSTLIGTIIIATSAQRAALKKEFSLAFLSVAVLYRRVIYASIAVRRVREWSEEVDISAFPFDGIVRQVNRLKRVGKWTDDEVLPIIPLPNRCAVNLVVSRNSIHDAIAALENLKRIEGKISDPDRYKYLLERGMEGLTKNIVNAERRLGEARDVMKVAFREAHQN
jgi:hypothetical protein